MAAKETFDRDPHRTTFRISGIPARFDQSDLSRVLLKALKSTDSSNLRIRSFSSDTSLAGEPQQRTAVVSFGFKPQGFSLNDDVELQVDDLTLSCDRKFLGFTPLSPVESDSQHIIDCIVLTGWGAHPIGSFMAQGSTHIWLIDKLARNFPQFRVWTYGYSPQLHAQSGGEDIHEFADSFTRLLRRLRVDSNAAAQRLPVIYLAHSLGGLLFKEAMIRMQRSRDEIDRENYLATFGALLFGVPSAGMDVEALAAMIGHLPARTTLSDLDARIGHRLKHKQHKEFCDAYHFEDSILARFFELDDTPTVKEDQTSSTGWSRGGPARMLVGFHSATIGRAWETDEEYIIGLTGNHSTMVKLPERPSDSYRKIYNVLEQFLKKAPPVIRSRFIHAGSGALTDESDVQRYSAGSEIDPLMARRFESSFVRLGLKEESAPFGRHVKSLQGRDAVILGKLRAIQRPIAERKLLDVLFFKQKREREDDVAEAYKNTFGWIFHRQESGDDGFSPLREDSEGRAENVPSEAADDVGRQVADEGEAPVGNEPRDRVPIYFVDWLKNGHGCYWINGKAGSGKSTLMKYLSKHPETEKSLSVWAAPYPVQTASFYFWSSGTDIQKSQEGLLRSLLHTVLKSCRDLVSVCFPDLIDSVLPDIIEKEPREPVFSDCPSFEDLKRAFMVLVKHSSSQVRLCFLIDGLDEYDGDIYEICNLFKNVANSSILKVIVSSRPIPACVETFKDCPGLRLQDLTQSDIQTFLQDSLSHHSRMKLLQSMQPIETDELVQDIIEKASGVFLWVILVTKSLLNGLSNFDRIEDLKRRVDPLPPQLHDLYKHMLKSMDPLYRTQASRLLQIVYQRTITRRDRTLTTLQLSFDDEDPSKAFDQALAPLNSADKLLRCEEMEGRLRSRCCGLIEVQRRSSKRGLEASMAAIASAFGWCGKHDLLDSEVKFLHKTVVDFLRDPEIWTFVISLCDDKEFDVNVSLVASCLRLLKSLPSEYYIYIETSEIWLTMRDCLFYSARAEESTGKPQTRYMAELNQVMNHHWHNAGRWMNTRIRGPDNEIDRRTLQGIGTYVMNDVQGDWTCTVDFPGRSPKHEDNFLSLAISHGLVLYLEDTLKRKPGIAAARLGYQSLKQILRSLAIDQYSKAEKLFAMIEILFRAGADPNTAYDEEPSAWVVALTYLTETLDPRSKRKMKLWSQILDLFVKAGADVNAPIDLGTSIMTPLAILEANRERAALPRKQSIWDDETHRRFVMIDVPKTRDADIVAVEDEMHRLLLAHGALTQTWSAETGVLPSSKKAKDKLQIMLQQSSREQRAGGLRAKFNRFRQSRSSSPALESPLV